MAVVVEAPVEGALTTARAERRRPRIALPRLTERTLLALLLLGVAVACWPTLHALLDLAGGDTPVSFVPLVPLMGAVLLWRQFDPRRIRARSHDGFVDGLALLLLGGLTMLVLLLLPVMMSWDYWLDRLDILGLVLLLTTLVVAAWGLPGLVQLGPALLYFLLAWPLPYLLLYNHIIPTLTTVTAQAVRLVAPLLPLGIHVDPRDPYALLVTYHGSITKLIVAQACAGVNGVLGLVVIGLPIALMGRGSWEARGIWLLLGAGLSWLVNVLRIVLIAAASAHWGPDMTMRLLHPELGLVLFAMSFALLLALAPLCGLDVAAPWRRGAASADLGAPAASMGIVLPWRRLLFLGMLLLAGGLVESNLGQFSWVSETALPRVGLAQADDLFHTPSGWAITGTTPISGWQPLFGPSTVAAALTVSRPGQAPIIAQAVLTRDAASFRAYGVEDCYIFHGFTLQAVHRMALGSGVTATLVDFKDSGQPVAALYWLQPVQTPQGLYHERLVLIVDAAQARALARSSRVEQPATAVGAAGNPVQRLATTLDELVSPWIGGSAGPEYQPANTALQRFAQLLIAQERHD